MLATTRPVIPAGRRNDVSPRPNGTVNARSVVWTIFDPRVRTFAAAIAASGARTRQTGPYTITRSGTAGRPRAPERTNRAPARHRGSEIDGDANERGRAAEGDGGRRGHGRRRRSRPIWRCAITPTSCSSTSSKGCRRARRSTDGSRAGDRLRRHDHRQQRLRRDGRLRRRRDHLRHRRASRA